MPRNRPGRTAVALALFVVSCGAVGAVAPMNRAGEPHGLVAPAELAGALRREATDLEAARRFDEALARWAAALAIEPGDQESLRAEQRLAAPGPAAGAIVLQDRLTSITHRLDQIDTRLTSLDSALALERQRTDDILNRFVAVDRALDNDGRALPITDRLEQSITTLDRTVQTLEREVFRLQRDVDDLRRRVR